MTRLWLLFACVQSDLDSGVGSLDCSQDCARPECVNDASCEEIPPPVEDCTDGIDNDGDGWVDCVDPDCSALCAEDCEDGLDNDLDGFVDCQDPDCTFTLVCEELCHDGVDNDGDGRIDCEDSECPPCTEGSCVDGVDGDQDGFVDCEDSDCEGVTACIEVCWDGLDNDADGFTDCEDRWDCGYNPDCREICGDGSDNDYDGLVDCEDADCQLECSESSCTDGVDNNANGRVDCADEDCWGLGDCPNAMGIQVHSGSPARIVWNSAADESAAIDLAVAGCSQPSGTVTIGLDGNNVSCQWEARFLSATQKSYWAATSGVRFEDYGFVRWTFSDFQTTGACAPYLSPEMLRIDSSVNRLTSDKTSLAHHLDVTRSVVAGPSGYMAGAWLDGVPLLAGPASAMGGSYQTFQIDPVYTQPWIFGP